MVVVEKGGEKDDKKAMTSLCRFSRVTHRKSPTRRLKANKVRLAYPELSATNPERKYKEPVASTPRIIK